MPPSLATLARGRSTAQGAGPRDGVHRLLSRLLSYGVTSLCRFDQAGKKSIGLVVVIASTSRASKRNSFTR